MLRLHANYNQVVNSTTKKIKTKEIYISLSNYGILPMRQNFKNFEDFCNHFTKYSNDYCGVEFSIELVYDKTQSKSNLKSDLYLNSNAILCVKPTIENSLMIKGTDVEWITVESMEEFYHLILIILTYKNNQDKLVDCLLEKLKLSYNK